MKKIIFIAASLLITTCILALCGCSNKEIGTSQPGVETSAAQNSETPTAEPESVVLAPEELAALKYCNASVENGDSVNVYLSESNSDGKLYYFCEVTVHGEKKTVVVEDGGAKVYSQQEYENLSKELEK